MLQRLDEGEAAAGFSWEEEGRMESEEPEMAELPGELADLAGRNASTELGSGSR